MFIFDLNNKKILLAVLKCRPHSNCCQRQTVVNAFHSLFLFQLFIVIFNIRQFISFHFSYQSPRRSTSFSRQCSFWMGSTHRVKYVSVPVPDSRRPFTISHHKFKYSSFLFLLLWIFKHNARYLLRIQLTE